MDSLVRLYFDAALEMGLKPENLSPINGFRIHLNRRHIYFRSGMIPLNDEASTSIISNKYCTNRLLHSLGFPVPDATALTKEEYEQDPTLALLRIKFPVACKPTLDTACGQDVYCNIPDKKHLILIIQKLFQAHETLSIEHYEQGLRSYRVLMLDYKPVAITERISAQVTGDGVHTIEQLIEIQNHKRKQLIENLPLYSYQLNDETMMLLQEQKISLQDIPTKGRIIKLRYVCNSSIGGTFKGVSVGLMHPYNKIVLSEAAKALNVRLGGFDFICSDIASSIEHQRGFIIEINAGPDITIHENITKGARVRVSRLIVKAVVKAHGQAWYKKMLFNPLVLVCVAFVSIVLARQFF